MDYKMSRPSTPTPQAHSSTTADQVQFASPPRSSTLPQKSSATKTHHIQYHHHHPHRSHRHDRSVPQSAIERSSTHPFGELLRLDRQHHRRNGSPPQQQPGLSHPNQSAGEETNDYDGVRENLHRARVRQQAQEAERRRREETETVRLRQRRQEGERELKRTLTHLNDLSTKMTRRLDYTYFALTASLGQLTDSVHSFIALARDGNGTQQGFVASTAELERDARGSVKGTGGVLDRQADRIGALQGRMKRGKGRIEELGTRLERVRQKIDEAEGRDEEGRKRAARRRRMLWSGIGTWLWIIMIALALRHWGHTRNLTPNTTSHMLDDILNDPRVVNASTLEVQQTRSEPKEAGQPLGTGGERSTCSVDAQATLDLFDHL